MTNIDKNNDNGNENPLFENLSDKMRKPIYSYVQIRQNNLNYIINEPEQKKSENYVYINDNNFNNNIGKNIISDYTIAINNNNNFRNLSNIFMNNNTNYFLIINQPNPYYQNYSNIYQFPNNIQYNQNILSKQYQELNIYNNNFNNILNNDKITSKMALTLIKTQSGCHLVKEKSIADHKFANELLFPEIKNNLKEICCNFISNSLVKTLLDILTYENIDLFISLTSKYLYDICLTESGSRIFQKLIERIYNSP